MLLFVIRGYREAHSVYMEARRTWLAGLRSIFLTDVPVTAEEAAAGMVYVAPWNMTEDPSRFPNDHFSLAGILEAEARYHGRYSFLVMGDADSYILAGNLYKRLLPESSDEPLFMGYVHPPDEHGCKNGAIGRPSPPFCCPEVPVGEARACAIPPARIRVPDDQLAICPVEPCTVGVHADCDTNPRYVHTVPSKTSVDEYAVPDAWAFGGAGMILSAGMVEAVGEAAWRRCLARIVCHGCDVRVSACIYKAGYAITSLGGLHENMNVWFSSNNLAKAWRELDPPPLSFHGLHSEQPSKAWEAELDLGINLFPAGA